MTKLVAIPTPTQARDLSTFYREPSLRHFFPDAQVLDRFLGLVQESQAELRVASETRLPLSVNIEELAAALSPCSSAQIREEHPAVSVMVFLVFAEEAGLIACSVGHEQEPVALSVSPEMLQALRAASWVALS